MVDKLKGKGKLTEKNIKDALREIKLSLLEADVNYKVVKNFINETKEKALGKEVLESLTPGQQLIKIVFDELKKRGCLTSFELINNLFYCHSLSPAFRLILK